MATLSSGGNSLSFSICQESSCESIKFSETTGTYTATNSGGWAVVSGAGASVNFTPSDAISAYLTITLPNGTVCPAITLYPTFPDTTETLTQTITSGNLGLSGSLPDGIYSATYLVNISNVNSQTVQLQVTQTFFIGCTIWCCVQKLIAKIAESECDCNSKALADAMLAFGLYQSMLSAAKCGNTAAVTHILARLTKLCATTHCGCS
jgi:NADPH-dependent 7-cyano-7-deazaguanine reductase QueF-like protein